MHGSGEFPVTEENERPGGTRGPGVPPAGGSGERSAPPGPPVEPPAVPPKPSTPPTSATPVVRTAAPISPQATPVVPPATPAAPPNPAGPATPSTPRPGRPLVPPVIQSGAGQPGFRGRRGARAAAGPAGAALAGATKAASAQTARLGGLIRSQAPGRIIAALVAVALMGVLVWWLTSLGGSSTAQPAASAGGADASPAAAAPSSAPAARGPLPLAGVGPLDFQLGDCFQDFDPEAQQSTIVDCTAGHSAQLIAIHDYPDSDTYPGLAALKDKGRETCRNAKLAAAATGYELKQRNAYPSSSSWDNGDRRVDCYVTADSGNIIMESLVP